MEAAAATTQTLASEKFQRLLADHAAGVHVIPQPCPGLVEQVEAGDFSGPATTALLDSYVRPLVERGADTIVLGCSHYPFLTPAIEAMAGAGVRIIDPALAVARELRRRLGEAGLFAPETRPGTERLWTSGDPAAARAVLGQLWPGAVDPLPLPVEHAAAGQS